MKRIHPLFVALLFLAASSFAFAGYSAIIAFGDSLSDNGNAFELTGGQLPPPPYVDGRVSNGPVAVEYMADALGLGLVDFAFLGAKTGTDINVHDNFRWDLGLDGTGMPTQVATFASTLGGAPVDPAALVFMWGGANDLFDFLFVNPAQSAANIAGMITDLHGLGARNFFVPNLPDLGRIPEFLGGPLTMDLSDASTLFNAELADEILSLEVSLPDATIIPFDTYSLFNEVLANPTAFGFTDVTSACLSLLPCALDPDRQATTLFWDLDHPTTAAHAVLGRAFANAVAMPEPGTSLLLGIALVLLGLQLRQRSGP